MLKAAKTDKYLVIYKPNTSYFHKGLTVVTHRELCRSLIILVSRGISSGVQTTLVFSVILLGKGERYRRFLNALEVYFISSDVCFLMIKFVQNSWSLFEGETQNIPSFSKSVVKTRHWTVYTQLPRHSLRARDLGFHYFVVKPLLDSIMSQFNPVKFYPV